MSIGIYVPAYDTICPETFKSIYYQQETEEHGRPLFRFVKGYACDVARNKCALDALDARLDYLMFVDSDIVLPSYAVAKLLSCHADIAMGVYPRKNTSTGQTELFSNDNYNFVDENNINISDLPSEPFEIKGGGMGCALIKTSLLMKMKIPYFKYVQWDNGSTLSEDNYFCWRASLVGASIVCNPRVRCGHRFSQFHWE